MAKSRTRQYSVLSLGVGALISCGTATGPPVPSCSGAVAVTATSGLTPSFAWTPNCLVDQVVVEEQIAPSAGGPQMRWWIKSRITGQGTAAPLSYGTVPASMQQLLSATTLVTGHSYTVIVSIGTTEIGRAVWMQS
jgi:hypothetical protein